MAYLESLVFGQLFIDHKGKDAMRKELLLRFGGHGVDAYQSTVGIRSENWCLVGSSQCLDIDGSREVW